MSGEENNLESRVQVLKGVKDILPDESFRWLELENTLHRVMACYGYSPVYLPIIEQTRLFSRGVGEATDIVEKQMYTFIDRGGRSISLRPEATASLVRAYVENGLCKTESLVKFYYYGPMFRNERPQAGRAREFHQIGVEVIGSLSPFVDVEVIVLSKKLLDEFGLGTDAVIKINSLGSQEDKAAYSNILKKQLETLKSKLCDTCKERLDKNVLRILDCKDPNCKKLVSDLAKPCDSLSKESQDHFEEVKRGLDNLGIKYVVDPYLVRGLDYYTMTTFEITHPNLGSQDAIGAGGRYNNLVGELGGPQKGAVGFALGVERIILASKNVVDNKAKYDVYVSYLGDEAKRKAFKITQELRNIGVSVFFEFEDRAFKKQFAQANKLGVKYVVTIGEEEIKEGVYSLKDMTSGNQEKVDFNSLVKNVWRILKQSAQNGRI